jgi:hypothetical protein
MFVNGGLGPLCKSFTLLEGQRANVNEGLALWGWHTVQKRRGFNSDDNRVILWVSHRLKSGVQLFCDCGSCEGLCVFANLKWVEKEYFVSFILTTHTGCDSLPRGYPGYAASSSFGNFIFTAGCLVKEAATWSANITI